MTDDHSEDHKGRLDKETGVHTTGHSWDGGSLEELNNPAPRWWVWMYILCTLWAIGYWVIYPSWPVPGGEARGAIEGTAGYSTYKELEKSQAEITARQAEYLGAFRSASYDDIMKSEKLYKFATTGGATAFKDNCATCHGSGGSGGPGFPNLNDDDWIWGGTIDDIEQTIRYGIRSNHPETRFNMMTAFGKDEILEPEEINQVVDFVLGISKEGGFEASAAKHPDGAEVFAYNCTACHGEDGKGIREMGGPNLTDAIWLYGGDRDTVYETVYGGRGGVMQAWTDRLDDDTIRQLAVYVHSLGGGE
ncbi:MAG: cytochrome-c oxidase, cbb3-type subunit III [Alphaproteobacteria bacterium]|nr:cytochrome-c oxidase, cbb3-type subunit III [Alphaproteobacteria bacterium]